MPVFCLLDRAVIVRCRIIRMIVHSSDLRLPVTIPAVVLVMSCSVCFAFGQASGGQAEPAPHWVRHEIDAHATSSGLRGADGVRLADVNGDGRLDVITPWEESGVIRVALRPSRRLIDQPWPVVQIGNVSNPEDAVLVDIDGDGSLDAVSCTEGQTKTVFFHWGPSRELLSDAGAWRTEAVPVTVGKQQWMFVLPMQVDGQHGIDLVVGSKNQRAEIGWLESPDEARRAADWRYHRLTEAGWIMSLIARDVDGDGDMDVIFSDRRGESRGVGWLEHPGDPAVKAGQPWRRHVIGAAGLEVMFIALGDLDGDGDEDVVVPTRDGQLILIERLASVRPTWREHAQPLPGGAQWGKAAAVGDINGDGKNDIVLTINTGGDRKMHGVHWLQAPSATTPTAPAGQAIWKGWTNPWQATAISGPEGIKFDLVELIDMDDDGDLDVLTCEERDNLGVFWYENPGQ